MPLLGKVPLTMPLREQADAGAPLVATDPDDPAAQAIRQAARGLQALLPVELPLLAVSACADIADRRHPGGQAVGDQPADGGLTRPQRVEGRLNHGDAVVVPRRLQATATTPS